MKVEHLVYTNKATNQMFNKHIKGKQIIDVSNGVGSKITDVTLEQIEKAIILHIYGAKRKCIAELLGLTYHQVTGIIAKKMFRKANLSFQTKKEKRLGKMWFVYDKELVEKYYEALPDELRQITIGGLSDSYLDEDKLIVKTKILKSEMIL